MYRAAIGPWVRHRLQKVPFIFKLPAKDLDIFVLREFLTAEECAGLIERIDVDRKPSGVLGDAPEKDYRTSETCNLDPTDPLIRQVEDKLTTLIGIDPAHGETIQGQRYAVGQQFKQHHDFFYADQAYWAEQDRHGGQRTWTAMIFLNNVEAGGQTAFPLANVRITPRVGNLLTWNNLDDSGEPNQQSLHQGMPVEAGVKYIITKWYRERPWSAASGA